MLTITLNSLDSLFSSLNERNDVVTWVTCNDYSAHLFINKNFKDLWGVNPEMMYESPELWQNFLNPEHRDQVMEKMNKRFSEDKHGCILYQVIDPKNELKHFKDQAFILLDRYGRQIGLAGYAEQLTEQQWLAEKNNIDTSQIYSRLIQDKLIEISQKHPDNHVYRYKLGNIQFSKREEQCIDLLLAGKTAKETADALFLSSRTVEMYLDNIKNKLGCKSKLEILHKLRQI